MWKKYKKKLSSLLIVTLIASLFVPQLNVIADTADVIVGDNGTIYDADYEPYIYDEDEWEEDDDESNVEILASGSNATPSNASLASDSNLASKSNWAEIFKTNVFTDAGPFMPAVEVPSMTRMMRTFALRSSDEDGTDTSKIVLSKKAEPVDDGYKITLEAYTTGTVVTTTKTTPVDIVLVLDQSGSMAFDFDGNSTNTNEVRRQYAMKEAVNNFITNVNEKFVAENSDHRIAIVTFGSKAETIQEWTFADESGADTLKAKINNLPDSPSGATNVAAGMEKAETLMSQGYNYNGNSKTRQKVVILFTDGVPTEHTEFSTDVADKAIESSKNLKDNGVTVYSIGIFNGAKPEQLSGDSGFSINSTGEIDSIWGNELISSIFAGDVRDIDIPAGNRFLNYLSSNTSSATQVGIESTSGFYGSGDYFLGVEIKYYIKDGWKITQKFEKDKDGYYLSAKDASSLNKVFYDISENISKADSTIDSTTVIKDIVTQYFDIPTDGSGNYDIKLYTSKYSKEGVFGEAVSAPSTVNVQVVDNAVSVTGFDFYKNYVDLGLVGRDEGNMNATGDFCGRKLIIEFTVTPKAEFLGGNGVPTNGAESGIYLSGSDEPLDTFDVPTVNVPIPAVEVTTEEKNVYLTGSLTKKDILQDAQATAGTVTLDFTKVSEDPENEDSDWRYHYVTISTEMNPQEFSNLKTDTEYTLEVTLTPKKEVEGGVKAQVGFDTSAIHVYRPELTYNDGTVYYGDKLPGLDSDDTFETYRESTVKWKWLDENNKDVYRDEYTSMTGTEPTLSKVKYVYEPMQESDIADGVVNTKREVPVGITEVYFNGQDNVVEYTWFKRNPCTDRTDLEINKDKKFVLHVDFCELTINKTGGDSNEPYVFTIKRNGQLYTYASVTGNSNVTIKELPVGTYSIEEDSGANSWSWRYDANDDNTVELKADMNSDEGMITFENTMNSSKKYWLNGFSTVWENISGIGKKERQVSLDE